MTKLIIEDHMYGGLVASNRDAGVEFKIIFKFHDSISHKGI